jgi:hypothetical protein
MYTGHIGIALAVRGARQDLSLWLLCIASLMPDLIDFAALAGKVDTSLWTHTLPGMLGFGVVFFGLGWLAVRNVAAGVLTGLTRMAACSHVLGDLVTSRLTLWAGGPLAGLHLYLHPAMDFGLEAAVVLAGWWLYGTTLPRDRRFSPASWAIPALLLALLRIPGHSECRVTPRSWVCAVRR